METTKKAVVGSCFPEGKIWEDESDGTKGNETSEDCLEKDLITYCLHDEHIKEQFTEIQNIGEGGFGSVYAAKNIIDSKRYALKLVPINSKSFEKREVQVLSSLNHKNIIRYYTSWIIKLSLSIVYPRPSSSQEYSDGITFENRHSSRFSCNTRRRKEEKENDKDFKHRNSSADDCRNAPIENESTSTCYSVEEEIIDACLVIQTELCSTKTNLKTLIDGQLFTMEDDQRRKLILDIIWGLQHIHDKGFMHRDLKPSNIFIGVDKCAKIGDFGLARKYFMPVTSIADDGYSVLEREGNVFSKDLGTFPYVAPEVRDTILYDKRADLYSLGMIIFEMFHKMCSGMERTETLERLRKQNFEDLRKIPEKYENVRQIVKNLLCHEPHMRMDLKMVVSLMEPTWAQQQILQNACATSCLQNGQVMSMSTKEIKHRYRQKM